MLQDTLLGILSTPPPTEGLCLKKVTNSWIRSCYQTNQCAWKKSWTARSASFFIIPGKGAENIKTTLLSRRARLRSGTPCDHGVQCRETRPSSVSPGRWFPPGISLSLFSSTKQQEMGNRRQHYNPLRRESLGFPQPVQQGDEAHSRMRR